MVWIPHGLAVITHKSIEMSLLKDVSMGAESGMWSRYPTLNSAFWDA